jgi:TonB-linked SusC/RagA family outer membrane protein
MKKVLLLIISIVITRLFFGQSVMISGNVLSASSHRPVEGATVKSTGSDIATITDRNGYFRLPVSDSVYSIMISHVGFQPLEQKISKSKTSGLIIFLSEKIGVMEEVIINNGYQQLPKERSTGSFETIDDKLFNRSVTPDILSRLEGVSGIFFSKVFGSSTDISIHGRSTLRAEDQPLIIIDNFPYKGQLENINPADVENVTILKDAAAASIWGAQAGNGVIVITTKKGRYNQLQHISVNSSVTVQQKPDLFYSPAFLDASDFIDVEKFLFGQGFYNSALNNTTSRPVISPVVEILARQRAGLISQSQADSLIDPLRTYDIRRDLDKYFYRRAITQLYTLSLSGGGNSFNYFLNAGFTKNLSSSVGNQYNKANLNASVSVKPFPKWELQAGMDYTWSRTWNNSIPTFTPGGGKSAYYPYARLVDALGNPAALEKDYRMAYLDTAGGGLLLDWNYRPLDELKYADNTSPLQDVVLKAGIKWNVLKSLSWEVKGQFEQQNSSFRNDYNTQTYFTRNLINRFSQRTGSGIKLNIPLGDILDNKYNLMNAYNVRSQLNYSEDFDNIHQVTAIAGAEISETHYTWQQGRTYGYDDLLNFANVDYVSTFALYGNLGSSAIPANINFKDQLNRFVSIFANASYTYDKRYTFSASARKDASNLFGVNANNKWQPLWSAGFSWKITNEKFYRIKWMPLLNWRFTYGYAGNVDNSVSALPIIAYEGAATQTNLIYATAGSPPNPDLHWENVKTINTGIDFSLFNNRLSGSFDFYLKYASDLLTLVPVDPTIGSSVMIKNAADLTGKGADVRLSGIIINKKIKWQSNLFFNYVTNKVTKYYQVSSNKGSYVGNGYSVVPIEGKDPYALISFKWAGLDPQTGDPRGYLNGSVSTNYTQLVRPASFDDLNISGTGRPPLYGNFLNTISWKDFSISANIAYRFHYLFRRPTIIYSDLFNLWMGNMDFTQRWQKPGDEAVTSIPSMTYPANSNRDKFYSNSTATLEKGDFIRLKDVSVSYELHNLKFGNLKLKGLQLYAYLNNIGIIWRANKIGLDPEYGVGTPAAFSSSFGCKLDF